MSRYAVLIQNLGYDRATAMLALDKIVEAHLKESREAPSRFGRRAVNNSRFVFLLREGRQCRAETVYRVLKAIKAFKPKTVAA